MRFAFLLLCTLNCAGSVTPVKKVDNCQVLTGHHAAHAKKLETQGTCAFLYDYGNMWVDFDEFGIPSNPTPMLLRCDTEYKCSAAEMRCTSPVAKGLLTVTVGISDNSAIGEALAVGEFAGCKMARYSVIIDKPEDMK